MDHPLNAQIKALLSEGRTSDALSKLLELSESNKQIHESILMVLSDYNDFNAQRLRGTLSNEEINLRRNKINEKILIALDSFDSNGNILPSTTTSGGNRNAKLLIKISLWVFGVSVFFGVLTGVFWQSVMIRGVFLEFAIYVFALGLIILGLWILSIFINSVNKK